jgi:hypothetical protein
LYYFATLLQKHSPPGRAKREPAGRPILKKRAPAGIYANSTRPK